MPEEKSDLKRELNHLWKAAVDQLDEIKDVIVQGTEVGRQKLDAVMLRQNREKVRAELGRLVHEHGPRDDMPESWRAVCERLDEIERDIAAKEGGPTSGHDDAGGTPGTAAEPADAAPEDPT